SKSSRLRQGLWQDIERLTVRLGYRRRLSGCVVHAGLTAALIVLCAPTDSLGQSANVCARVKIEILQRVTFERAAFDARLVITNNLTDETLTNVGVTLKIANSEGQDKSTLFFMRVSSLNEVNAVDGTGSIAPGVRAEAHWLIVPSAGAGGESDSGSKYFVG